MSGVVNIEHIVPQLQHAYLSVLQMSDEQEARHSERFFQKDGTPNVQTIRVPDPHRVGMWQKVDVPLYALIPLASLQVKELTVEFESRVEGLVGFESSSPDVSKPSGKKARRKKPRKEIAQVRITLKRLPSGTEDSEGNALATSTYTPKVWVDVTIVYPKEILHSYRILG